MDHTVVHFEIPADEPERAAQFYRELFGWTIDKWEPPLAQPDAMRGVDYWLISTVPTDGQGRPTRPGVNGGMMKRTSPGQPPANYISVESVNDYGHRAEGLGGQVVVPKTAVPGMGWFCYIKDTEGNLIGLWETDPNAG
jgi:predicted enzyme related to lactoylglutathione lyase